MSLSDNIAKKLAEFTQLSIDRELLVPPHVFDTSTSLYTLSEIHDLWNKGDIATLKKAKRALYVHIPYCKSRCAFCMYDSRITRVCNLATYVDRCTREIEFWQDELNGILESVYFGGGTPSILSEADLRNLLRPISHLKYVENSSRTFELSPDTATESKLDILRKSHINRISLGVQSLDETVLKNVRRQNPPITIITRLVAYANKLGFDDINIDLMVGLDGQNELNVVDSVRKVIDMNPLSITIYTYRNIHQKNSKSTHLKTVESQRQLETAFKIFDEACWSHVAGNLETEYNIFASPLRKRKLIRHKTSIDVLDNLSLIGIGSHAIGFNPSIAYQCDSYEESFDIEKARYVVYRHTPLQQIRLAVCNMLYRNDMTIDRELFKSYFGLDFEDVFCKELGELSLINRVGRTDASIIFLSNSIYEAAGIQKFFWDQDFLQKYRQ